MKLRVQRTLEPHAVIVTAPKNNTDSAGNSYGCHENYLVSRDVSFQRLAEALIPFFVTRQIFAGAGTFQAHDERVERLIRSF